MSNWKHVSEELPDTEEVVLGLDLKGFMALYWLDDNSMWQGQDKPLKKNELKYWCHVPYFDIKEETKNE